VPAGVALAQGDVTQAENIVLGGTMGEQDFLQIPAMLCGVTAAETTLSRAIGWMSGGGGSGRFVLAGKAVIWSELTDKIVTRIFLANGERMRKAFDLWRQGGGPSLPPAGERTERAFVAWLIGWDVKISPDGTIQMKNVEAMLLHKTYAEIFIGFFQRGLSIEARADLTAVQRQFMAERFRDPMKIGDELEGWVTIRNVAYALLGRPIP
ncbi:MAG: hypothetical protein Q7S98_03020, partial [Deltaproteobacteria bacterium]|nr:hypothetical protein [Deltaproteobacteria bacterium]